IDLLLIVPATANIIAKFANGVADDFLSSTYLASNAPVLVAPAMNTTMWENPATQRNVEQLKKDGVHFVEPVAGELACKTVGTGKLEDVENIVRQALDVMRNAKRGVQNEEKNGSREAELKDTEKQIPHFALRVPHSKDLAGETFLLTVGGTREAIDPIRFISNHSSGKMGFAVAEAARDRGASVTIVAGVTTADPPHGVTLIRALSAEEMHAAVMKHCTNSTVFVGAAAVADYAPAKAEDAKIKKDGNENLTLELKKTPDILADVSANRTHGLLVVGFAAETNDVVDYARSKMKKKNLDIVVANDITRDGAGFNTDTNIATIITPDNEDASELPMMSKRQLADKILDKIVNIRKSQNG
ncbi:MAG: bifunctional phosphopantothenoylcysteine decarboxylase/phosphopantothenate--cysteine ligase CoaBC, partial [Acidobacteriota bacterium]